MCHEMRKRLKYMAYTFHLIAIWKSAIVMQKETWEPFYLVSEKIAFLKGKNNVADKMLFSCTIVQYLPGNSRTDVIKIKEKLLFLFESLQFFFSFSFYNNHFLQSFFFWYSFLRDNLFALKKKTEKIEALFP